MSPRLVRWMPAAVATGVCLLTFMVGPFAFTNFLQLIPGDTGDARLNNYFLENIYQFFRGGSDSLWHLHFFEPFPYVLGFSDNLFGASAVYLVARAMTLEPDTSFQLWALASYFANFAAAYYALRRFAGVGLAAAVVGAVIFAFALPVTPDAGHAQLSYRFGVPLAVGYFAEFLERRSWLALTWTAAWLVWQFYCGVYIGFFILLMLVVMSAVFVGSAWRFDGDRPLQVLRGFGEGWAGLESRVKIRMGIALASLTLLMALLFFPYLQVQHLYHFKRGWREIASMLPRMQSYFLADWSTLWSSRSPLFAEIPVRHEHQMFIGAVPMVLAIAGFLTGSRRRNGPIFTLMSVTLGVLVILTLYLGGLGLWLFLYKLPLASAIRAVARIELVMLLPAAYLAALAIDLLMKRGVVAARAVSVLIIPLLIFETAAMAPEWSPKSEWRERAATAEAKLPKTLPADPILFYAQTADRKPTDDIDPMWVALRHRFRTMNGYSGSFPQGYDYDFGAQCAELPRRVLAYLAFAGTPNDERAYLALMQRAVPVGFSDCQPAWWAGLPKF